MDFVNWLKKWIEFFCWQFFLVENLSPGLIIKKTGKDRPHFLIQALDLAC